MTTSRRPPGGTHPASEGNGQPPAVDGGPRREPGRAYVTDPRHIRVLAHPGRLAILWRLESDGPATATECARIAGMSPSAASYHLRQLARYGFVGPAPRRGDRRERVWEARVRGFRVDDEEDADPEVIEAQRQLLRAAARSSDELTERWLLQLPEEPHVWRESAIMAVKGVRITAEELRQLYTDIAALIAPYLAHRRAVTDAPPGARLVHIDLRMFPWEDPPTQVPPPNGTPAGAKDG